MTAAPKKPDKYTHRIPVALTSAQLEAIDKAAEAAGLRRSEWMRMVLLKAAK